MAQGDFGMTNKAQTTQHHAVQVPPQNATTMHPTPQQVRTSTIHWNTTPIASVIPSSVPKTKTPQITLDLCKTPYMMTWLEGKYDLLKKTQQKVKDLAKDNAKEKPVTEIVLSSSEEDEEKIVVNVKDEGEEVKDDVAISRIF